MDKLKMQTGDLSQENIDKIAKIFPQVITEKKDETGDIKKAVDFDLLKQHLSDSLVEGGDERYRLDWPGKKASILKANTPITDKTLRPAKEESENFDKTENIYIEGDNFQVLKLLQESYLNKVKMIYIDPPYNRKNGGELIYKDNFSVSQEEYEVNVDAVDNDGNKLFRNTTSNGRFHSDWLSMMYERLVVARDLLREDGVIFISIDDNEVINLRKICDEVFGEENFQYQLSVVNNLNGNDNSSGMMETQEYCLIYSKNEQYFNIGVLKIDDDLELDKWSVDSLGFWKEGGSLKATGINAPRLARPNLFFPIYINESDLSFSLEKDENYSFELLPITDKKEMSWYWSRDKFLREKDEVIIKRVGEGFSLYKKQRPSLGDMPSKRGKTTFYKPQYSNSHSTATIKSLFGDKFFDYSKSVFLIKDFIELGNFSNEIILDFFSGSATTAHAVMQLNAEDGGNRKFIMVQLPEEIDEKSEAYKAGYKNISEIGKERIRRAAKKIQEENKDKDLTNVDFGFRVFKLDSSNMKDVFYKPAEITQSLLADLESNIKEDRSPEDLLIQVMLDLGLKLSHKIESKDIFGHKVFFVESNALVACFDENIDFNIVDEIAKIKPLKVVFRDACFKDDKDRINVEERFKSLSPESGIKVI
jgi:adenine-specific DNA-methyltransferase